MRRFALAMLLAAIVFAPATVRATPGSAASTAGLPYNLTWSPRPGPASSTGTVTGKFGGVPVKGTYSGSMSSGALTLTVDGATFAVGTYLCASSECTFTGTVAERQVAGMPMSPGLSAAGRATSSTFPDRSAWVSAVATWASAKLGSDQAWRILSAAASVEVAQTFSGPEHDNGSRDPRGGGTGGGGTGMDGGMR